MNYSIKFAYERKEELKNKLIELTGTCAVQTAINNAKEEDKQKAIYLALEYSRICGYVSAVEMEGLITQRKGDKNV